MKRYVSWIKKLNKKSFGHACVALVFLGLLFVAINVLNEMFFSTLADKIVKGMGINLDSIWLALVYWIIKWGLCALAVVYVFVRVYRLSDERTPKPKIVINRHSTEDITIYSREHPTGVSAKVASVYLANESLHRGNGAIAQNVIARLTFVNEFGETLMLSPQKWIPARWVNRAGYIMEHPNIDSEEAHIKDILPNGIAQRIDIAIKHFKDENCYAFNFDSRFEPKWKIADWELKGKRFKVHVEIAEGMNIIAEKWYVLSTRGKDDWLDMQEEK
ncbi:MAG: hypothetical protein CVV03_06175 [Firmicutes bacterium HGW-Firmicutes-8]|nr:MAG: hypothetical protein CVV03_06175 [Firmicutes bacterium HGW-Firmicutes-8]